MTLEFGAQKRPTAAELPSSPSDGLPCDCDPDMKLESPLLRGLLERWRERHVAGALPGRGDFDPLELREYLGSIFVVKEEPETDDFRYTLIGTRITEQVGVDNTGRTVGEVFGRPGQVLYRAIRDGAMPMRVHGQVVWRDQEHKSYETLILPLADDGRRVDRFIGAMVFGSAR